MSCRASCRWPSPASPAAPSRCPNARVPGRKHTKWSICTQQASKNRERPWAQSIPCRSIVRLETLNTLMLCCQRGFGTAVITGQQVSSTLTRH